MKRKALQEDVKEAFKGRYVFVGTEITGRLARIDFPLQPQGDSANSHQEHQPGLATAQVRAASAQVQKWNSNWLF
jgi:hypothetical protein